MKLSRLRPSISRHAFTLIELLVVISIIALLIGILLPALASARSASRQSTGLANMHQIGIAANAYTVDFKDFMCPADLDPSSSYDLAWQSYLWYQYLNRQNALFLDQQLRYDEYYNPATSVSKYSNTYGQLKQVSYIMNLIRPMSDSDGWGSSTGIPWSSTTEKRNRSGWTGIPFGTKSYAVETAVRLSDVKTIAGAIFVTDHRRDYPSPSTGLATGIATFLNTDHGDETTGKTARKIGNHQPGGRFNALHGDAHAATLGSEPTKAEDWVAYNRQQ